LSIADKFVTNSWGNRQLTERTFVKIWQTSTTIDEVERRYNQLIESYYQYLAEQMPRESYEADMEKKKALIWEVECNGKPKTHRYRTAKWLVGFIKHATEQGEDGYRVWLHRLDSFAPKKSLVARAKRLRKNGVVNLRTLKRAPAKCAHYADLNSYAASLMGL
jgi:hypothetical protein